VVVNSTYERVAGLHASVHVHNVAWKELYHAEARWMRADSSQIVFTLPESSTPMRRERFFIDLTLTDGRQRGEPEFLLGARNADYI
jgi:hypothetical protein